MRDVMMSYQRLSLCGVLALIALFVITMGYSSGRAQTAAAHMTQWGEVDLQGIWSVELLVPPERPAGATSEFYTEEEVAELDRRRGETSVFGNRVIKQTDV